MKIKRKQKRKRRREEGLLRKEKNLRGGGKGKELKKGECS
jgi:hypothetical protein